MAKRKIIEKWESQQAEKHASQTEEKVIKYKSVAGKTLNQKEFIKTVQSKRVTIAIGPAGAGKSYISVGLGIQGVLNGDYDQIVICRPAREAVGEFLGFLPGDFKSKIDVYLQPIYDAVDQIIESPEDAKKFKAERIKSVAFAFMRGLTFRRSFIVADEMSNATHEQIEMLITRIGVGSKLVISGDPSQSDLPRNLQGALRYTADLVKNSANFGVVELKNSDIMRDPIVAEYLALKAEYERPRQLGEFLSGYHDRAGDDEEIIGGW